MRIVQIMYRLYIFLLKKNIYIFISNDSRNFFVRSANVRFTTLDDGINTKITRIYIFLKFLRCFRMFVIP